MTFDSTATNPSHTALAALRRFARPRPAQQRCDLCSLALASDHDHLLELASRRLVCACEACAILFGSSAAATYRRVPRQVRFLPDFRLPDIAWEALQLPVNLAFFLHSTPAGRVVAFYPSPGGATEASVPADSWQMIVEDNPVLSKFQPDVEALLVNRVSPARECYRVGIDACYKLVGLIRRHWQGFSGGQTVWDEVGRFFARLKERTPRA